VPCPSAGQASTDDAHQEQHREDTTMTERIRIAYLRKRLEIVGKEMGWNTTETWLGQGTFRHSARNAVFLQRGPVGGWRVVQFTNESGGEHNLTGNGIMTASELCAWFDGVLFAKTGIR
jgi:hypothetical protein